MRDKKFFLKRICMEGIFLPTRQQCLRTYTLSRKEAPHQPLNPRQAADSKCAATQGECALTHGHHPLRRKAQALWLLPAALASPPLTRLGGCVSHKHPKNHSLKECMGESEQGLREHS